MSATCPRRAWNTPLLSKSATTTNGAHSALEVSRSTLNEVQWPFLMQAGRSRSSALGQLRAFEKALRLGVLVASVSSKLGEKAGLCLGKLKPHAFVERSGCRVATHLDQARIVIAKIAANPPEVPSASTFRSRSASFALFPARLARLRRLRTAATN